MIYFIQCKLRPSPVIHIVALNRVCLLNAIASTPLLLSFLRQGIAFLPAPALPDPELCGATKEGWGPSVVLLPPPPPRGRGVGVWQLRPTEPPRLAAFHLGWQRGPTRRGESPNPGLGFGGPSGHRGGGSRAPPPQGCSQALRWPSANAMPSMMPLPSRKPAFCSTKRPHVPPPGPRSTSGSWGGAGAQWGAARPPAPSPAGPYHVSQSHVQEGTGGGGEDPRGEMGRVLPHGRPHGRPQAGEQRREQVEQQEGAGRRACLQQHREVTCGERRVGVG